MNSSSNYYYTKKFSGSFDQAESAIKASLSKQGFGILTEINIQTALKEKLNVDYPKYKILGACNPPLAYQALQAEPEIGLLLPCNVIVYEQENQIFISIMKPTAALGLTSNPKIAEIAKQAEQKLIQALNL